MILKTLLLVCLYIGITHLHGASVLKDCGSLWETPDLRMQKENRMLAYRAYLFLRMVWIYHLGCDDTNTVIAGCDNWTPTDFFRRAQGSLLESTQLDGVLQYCKNIACWQTIIEPLERFLQTATSRLSFTHVFDYFEEQTCDARNQLLLQLTAAERAACINDVHQTTYPSRKSPQLKKQRQL